MALSEQQIFQALTTLTHAVANDRLAPGSQPEQQPDMVRNEDPVLATMDSEAREVLGKAALAVAFGAFASRGGFDGPMHTMVAALGLMAMLAGQEPDPPAEIMSVVADGERVEAEIDRAGEALDREFGSTATAEDVIAALEARILGSAITLAECTLSDTEDGQAAVRLRAARGLLKLAAGLMTMNMAGPGEGTVNPPGGERDDACSLDKPSESYACAETPVCQSASDVGFSAASVRSLSCCVDEARPEWVELCSPMALALARCPLGYGPATAGGCSAKMRCAQTSRPQRSRRE